MASRLLAECSQACFSAVTLQGELCKDFFERCVTTIPNCLRAGSTVTLALPWPFCVLTVYGAMSSVAFRVQEMWPRGCDITNIVKGWLRSELIDDSDDDAGGGALPDDAPILEPQNCRDLADFLRARIGTLVGAVSEQDAEDERALVESKVAYVFFYGTYYYFKGFSWLVLIILDHRISWEIR